jgi:hypothetical protein
VQAAREAATPNITPAGKVPLVGQQPGVTLTRFVGWALLIGLPAVTGALGSFPAEEPQCQCQADE